MEIPVKLPVFEGPLALLLHLIDKNKINIYDIPIVTITDQYMDYLRQMEAVDLDSLSEFLLMAATLLDIKCRMLLPKAPAETGEEEEDPRAELVARLQEYKMFKYIGEQLKIRETETGERLFGGLKLPREVAEYEEPVAVEAVLAQLPLRRLQDIFREVLAAARDKIDPVRSRFGKIERETVSLKDKMADVASYAARHKRFSFRELLTGQHTRVQVVVAFLAILELIRDGRLTAVQEAPFGDILLETKQAKEEKEQA